MTSHEHSQASHCCADAPQRDSGAFLKAFTPGLVVGLVIGAFVGVAVTEFGSSQALPAAPGGGHAAADEARTHDREEVPADRVPATEEQPADRPR